MPAARRPGNGSGESFPGDDQPEPRSAECRTDAVLPTLVRKSYRARRSVIAAVVGTLCLAAIGTAVNWRWFSARENVSAPRLSIVVLPFTNLSNDPDQQYFADAVTEDLTTDLSQIAHMFVISSSTAFKFKGKPIDTNRMGRELGVRYVLEGSVERSGSQARVNAQLINAETDAHLWAERFDRDTGDLFALQNEITRQIAIALNSELVSAEAARPDEHPDALDYILQGRAAQLNPSSADVHAKAISMFRTGANDRSRLCGGENSVGVGTFIPGTRWPKYIPHERHHACRNAD